MISFSVKTSKVDFIKPAQVSKIAALALTKTAQDAQTAVIGSLPKNFTIRTPWWKKTSKFGIKVKPAEKSDATPTAEVGTNADWLALHEEGGTKKRTGSGKNLAIPTTNVRRTKRDIIQKGSRPRRLKRAFVMQLKDGRKALFQRKGKRKKSTIKFMYLLQPRANIKERDTVIDPAVKSIGKSIHRNFYVAMDRVIKTKSSQRGA